MADAARPLQVWLRELHEKISVTTVLVTHDQEEAIEVADRAGRTSGQSEAPSFRGTAEANRQAFSFQWSLQVQAADQLASGVAEGHRVSVVHGH